MTQGSCLALLSRTPSVLSPLPVPLSKRMTPAVKPFTVVTWKGLIAVVLCCLLSLPLWMAVVKTGAIQAQSLRPVVVARAQKPPTFAVVTPYIGLHVDKLIESLRSVWPEFSACEGSEGDIRYG